MAVRSFVRWPDSRLRRVADPVGAITDEIRTLWDDMFDTMYAMPGIGLAAPQIGVMLRVAVIDAGDGKQQPIRLANPEILHQSTKFALFSEASPNLPGVHAEIRRPRAITISYLDHTGTRVRKDFVGMWARSILHQIDHLNGRMYFDNLSAVKRRMLVAKAAKKSRKTTNGAG